MSQAVLAHLVHRFARQVRQNGVLCLSANGDPALVAAFHALGWSDPCPLGHALVRDTVVEAATVEAPERAVMPKSRGRLG